MTTYARSTIHPIQTLVVFLTTALMLIASQGCSRATEGNGRVRPAGARIGENGGKAGAEAGGEVKPTIVEASSAGGSRSETSMNATPNTNAETFMSTSVTTSTAASASTIGQPALETAIFGMGCFWSPEEMFRQVPGVVNTAVGYSGGRTPNPTYREVCTDSTGHAEVVQVEFDPTKVGYVELLELFWKKHNPTQLNYQGPDVGEQYRSVIYFTTPEQERIARESKARLEASKKWPRPIVTQIEKAGTFHRAEEYHQRYYQKRGGGSCPTGLPD